MKRFLDLLGRLTGIVLLAAAAGAFQSGGQVPPKSEVGSELSKRDTPPRTPIGHPPRPVPITL